MCALNVRIIQKINMENEYKNEERSGKKVTPDETSGVTTLKTLREGANNDRRLGWKKSAKKDIIASRQQI